MVNQVLNVISTQLHATFGDNYRYYVEDVEQNLHKPCFTIDTIIPLQRLKSPVLYDRTMPMVIHYFPKDKSNTKKECYAVAEQITECLEYLPFLKTILRGENISWHMVDDVLQVFVTYVFTTKKVTTTDSDMNDLVVSNKSHI